MSGKDIEKKRLADRLYYEQNCELIRARKKARRAELVAENPELARLKNREAYLKRRDKALAQQKEYRERKKEETGHSHNPAATQAWRERNREKLREKSRESAARIYRADAVKAAKKRAKTIIHMQTGIGYADIPADLVEAKAFQLMAFADATRPNRRVGEVMTEEERSQKKRAGFKRWYEENKERRSAYGKEWRRRKAAQDTTPRPK